MKYAKAIAAMSANRVIGRANAIPWQLPEDFAWFKKMTLGHTLLMGRKTFASIGRPLPGRRTIVLTRTRTEIAGARVVSDLREIDAAHEPGEIFVCGGAAVYRTALPFCSDLYLTLVKKIVEGGDAFFPAFEDDFKAEARVLDRPEFEVIHYRNRNPRPWPRWQP